jgi:outer membrane protein assembly factor BamA
VGAVTITGLTHTRDDVVRRELSLEPGVLLTVPRLRASGRRLREVGVFPRVALRPTPRGDGRADVEAALTELHGLAASPLEFVVTTGTYLLQRRARLQYANLGGEGITAVAEHRFEDHRPETSVGLSWPRPLGLPAYLRLRGWRGRQDYAVDTAMLRERSRGATVSLRRVFTARAVGQLSLRLAHLSGVASEGGGEGAWDGRLLGAEAGLDGSLVQTRRHRLETLVRAAGSGGAGRSYLRGSGGLRYYAHLGAPEDEGMGASVLAAQTRVGAAGRPAPLADRFALGVSPEMELPLRGRFRAPDGIQDGRLLARSFVLHNLEWRRRVVRATGLQAGIVLFHDGARLAGVAGERPRWLHDVGGGVRLAVAGGPLLRVDYGRGLTDGRQSVSFGLDQAF